MESYKQFLQVAVTQFTFFFQSRFLNLFRINLIQRYFTTFSEAGMISLIMLIACPSNAAPPDQVTKGSASYVSSANARLSKNLKEEWAKGRILVMPRAGLPARAFADILKEHGGRARKIGQSDLYIVELPEYSEVGAVEKLRNHPHLKFVELDRVVSAALVPDDPYYVNAWHLSKIGVPAAWDITQGIGVTIAILDTGISSTHPDLAANMVQGWNFYDNTSNTSDVIGHGTIVAGTAAAVSNNSVGVSSVAGQSKIMPLRITDANGYGYYGLIAQALTYAADNGVKVANISFQNISSSSGVQAAAQYMKNKNGLVVVAAGNTGALETYTTTTTMIPVSATDQFDIKKDFSSYGSYVSLAAPGVNIWSTNNNSSALYASFAGTSFASPVVGGVIALMMSANPKLNSSEIESLLFSTAVDLGAIGRDPYYGHGRVDAAAAVQAAKSVTPIQDSESPVVSILDPLGGATVTGLVPVDVEATDNVGVTRAELWVNDVSVAMDSSPPFAFTWDSTGVSNGTASLAVRVFDAADNIATSSVAVDVDNPIPSPLVDTQPPAIQIINPVAGNVSGNVNISINAFDDNGASGISLSIYIDGILKATGNGSSLATSWNTRSKGVKVGMHTIKAVGKDAAGDISTVSVTVNVVK